MEINVLKHPSGFLKLIEIALLVLIMALFFSQPIYCGWTNFVASVFVPCFINAIVFVIIMLMGYDQLQKTPLEVILYTYYAISFFVSAVLLFTTGNGPSIAAGLFCLMIMAVYGADWYFAFVKFNGRPPPFLPGGQMNPQATSSDTQNNLPGGYGVGSVGFTSEPGHHQSYPDAVDLGTPSQANAFNINPAYPATMNYPPANLAVDSPPEFPANMRTQPKA